MLAINPAATTSLFQTAVLHLPSPRSGIHAWQLEWLQGVDPFHSILTQLLSHGWAAGRMRCKWALPKSWESVIAGNSFALKHGWELQPEMPFSWRKLAPEGTCSRSSHVWYFFSISSYTCCYPMLSVQGEWNWQQEVSNIVWKSCHFRIWKHCEI